MSSDFGKMTRISAIAAVFVALMFLAAPVLQIGGKNVSTSPVGGAAAANGNRVFNVGIIAYQGSVATLNPWVYTMSSEFETIWPCYSTLLTYDENSHMVGDLANTWSVSPNGTLWHLTIANNAYFIDPANPTAKTHQVTANDVFWTLWECQNDTGNHLSSYFNNAGQLIIKKMWTGTSLFDIYIQTNFVYSPFLGALTVIPIVPKYIWNSLTHGDTPLTYSNLPPIGSGFFYYGNGAILPGQVGVLKRNPIWFQEENRGWQIHVDTLNYKSQSDEATAWLELTKADPTIDVYMNMGSSQYLANLAPPHTTLNTLGFHMATGFEYEYQLNQLNATYRAQLEAVGLLKKGGTNNPDISNPAVELALAMCIDRATFIQTVSDGLASTGDSVVPACNRWHYTNPSPVPFDTAAARAVLNNAGWAYDSSGNYNPAATPLYKVGGTHGLNFNIFSLNTDPDWQVGANLLVQWAAQAGVVYTLSLQNVNNANGLWYSGNYDSWLWDWVFTPLSDPSTDCLSVHTTMGIGTWSGSFFHNKTFDDMYNLSLLATTDSSRMAITNGMQQLLYDSHMVNYISYPEYLYGVSTVHWNGASYGNWNAHFALMPDQGYPWLYMKLAPVDNLAPTVSVSSPTGYNVDMGSPVSVSGTSSQTTNIQYQWYWGDGTVSGWLAGATTSHTYSTDGAYTAYFAAKQTATADAYSGWNKTTITVVDTSNMPPAFGSPAITMTPSTGITTATYITFVAHATDSNLDPIYYSWDFGDGTPGTGDTVVHRYDSVGPGGSWTVHCYITDNRAGSAVQTATQGVPITLNVPPVISIAPNKVVLRNALTTFTATASDGNGEALRFTWYWGDGPGGNPAGPPTVTTVPSAAHTYTTAGKTYTLQVHADDLTGLPGHNVTATEAVKCVNAATPPVSVTDSVAPHAYCYVGQTLTFTGSAQDPAGDAMQFDFVFGDGTDAIVNNPATAPSTTVTNSSAHIYNSAGTFAAYMSATDGLSTTSSTSISITVTLNHTPTMPPQTPKSTNQGMSLSFSASATDLDNDPLRYTWNFGDGTPLVVSRTTTHTYVKAGYYNFTVFVDDLTGIPGHNVSSTAQASIAFNLTLAVGWNFVSVPLVGFGYKASTLPGLAFGDVIASWSSATQSYDHNYIKGISPSGADFNIAPNSAYWVWVAVAKVIHPFGSVPTTARSFSFTVPLSGGWIALGLNSLKTTWHAVNITGQTTPTVIPAFYSGTGAITLVAKYNAGAYTTFIRNTPLNNFLLVPGVGYWCWATASGTITYIP
jgi:ABC-type oligopeptide transport system substrate-binding subunit